MSEMSFKEILDQEMKEHGISSLPPKEEIVHYAYSEGEVFRCSSKVQAERISRLTEEICENEEEIKNWNEAVHGIRMMAVRKFKDDIYNSIQDADKKIFDLAFGFVDREIGVEHENFVKKLTLVNSQMISTIQSKTLNIL